MRDAQRLVSQFQEKHGQHVADGTNMLRKLSEGELVLRARLIAEEADEYVEATDSKSYLDMLDALCDLSYVVLGTAEALNIDLWPYFQEVHRSNMTKDVATTDKGKVVKGPSYEEPNLLTVMHQAEPLSPIGTEHVRAMAEDAAADPEFQAALDRLAGEPSAE